MAHVAHPDRRPVSVCEHDVLELLGLGDLVVCRDSEAELVRVDRALGGVTSGRDQHAADFLESEAGGGKLRRVNLHPDGRNPVAENSDLRDAWHLRDLLREKQIAIIVDGSQRDGF
jgi:hypothetical protein